MQGKTVLLTGATSGIGFASAAELGRRGACVIVHGRSRASADAAIARLRTAVPSGRFERAFADLANLAEVRALADDVRTRFPALGAVVHNAGVERWTRHVTADGLEETFAVNHVAPFLLTRLLLPALVAGAPSRVLFVSSVVHRWGHVHWDDLQASTWYAPEPVYYQSKLAAMMTMLALARRLGRAGVQGVTVNALEPGLTRTAFARDFRGFAKLWAEHVGALLFREPEAVAREIADAVATDATDATAAVTGTCFVRGETRDPAARAQIPEEQERMWRLTSELAGLPADDKIARFVDPVPARRSTPAAATPTRHLLARWVAACVTGEILGFGATALVALGAIVAFGRPETTAARVAALAIMTVAGMLEGASLGYFQYRVLSRRLQAVSRRAWVGATACVAAAGWFLGMLAPLLVHLLGGAASHADEASVTSTSPASMITFLLLAASMGAVVGALFGAAQWLVLRRHVERAGRWIAANAVGWALGLPWAYAAGQLGSGAAHPGVSTALAVAGAVAMGATMALPTGLALTRFRTAALHRSRSAASPRSSPSATATRPRKIRARRNRSQREPPRSPEPL